MRRKYLIALPFILAVLAFFFGMFLGHLNRKSMTEDKRFENYTYSLFREQIQTNTINLHYTLADPSEYGIRNYPVTLGEVDAVSLANDSVLLEEELEALEQFDYESLSPENQLTYDILKLSLETDLTLGDNYLLTELLSPTLGVQAQLPILLAEYSFRCKQDVEDYLELIEQMDSYFEQIIEYEKIKSRSGLFMNDTTADRIIAQCQSFIADADSNYLLSVFADKIQDCDFLSSRQKKRFIKKHNTAIAEHLIPAYQNLIQCLQDLKGTGKNPYGLSHFSGGKEYYEYLVKSITGVYDDIDTIEQRLRTQLESDFTRLRRLLKVQDEASGDFAAVSGDEVFSTEPVHILEDLQKKMSYDFPQLKDVEYDVKYVHADLEEYLSPAFYLTPPFDTMSPNSINLNNSAQNSDISLYTTLAHEGFPGHMYQTLYFAQTDPDPVRYLMEPGGYVEGWATYIESYAYQYSPLSSDTGEMLWLNRSLNLCIYSLTDIGIHYHGWTMDETTRFLNIFGITDEDSISEIYQCILEDPANYLQYYVGCLYFMDIRDNMETALGNDFDLQEYHRKILEIGPAPFPILEKYLSAS